MIVKSCHAVRPATSRQSNPTAVEVFKCKLFSCENKSPRITAVAAPAMQNPCTTTGQFVVQSSRPVLVDRQLYQDNQKTGLGISVHQRQKNKYHDGNVQLADTWKEIQGSDNWNGMLNPLHPLLLSEIIKYGEFVRACYEAFDLEPGSKLHGLCKYGPESLLSELGMDNCGYQVTKYIYATPGINVPDFIKNKLEGDRSNWIGYVAVTQDEEIKRLGRRDIVVALRGTATCAEWVANLMYSLTPARLNPSNPSEDVKVEMGFLGLYTSKDSTSKFNNGSAREQLLSEIVRLVQKYKGEELSITLTGHSMGSALSILCAYDIAELDLNCTNNYSRSKIPVTVYSFAGPRVGNAAFRDRCSVLGLGILRVVNVHDVVTKIPGVILNENFRLWESFMDRSNPWTYYHVGVELALDHKLYRSIFKPKAHHPSCIHDLETYLQILTCCSCNNHGKTKSVSGHNNFLLRQQISAFAKRMGLQLLPSKFIKPNYQ